MAAITLDGSPCATNGDLPKVGDKAPAFRLVRSDLTDVSLADYAGKRKVLVTVPSVDTGVCQATARVFNARAASRPNTVVLIASVDTPFAQHRFCEADGIDGVTMLSTLRTKAFAKDYGVLIVDGAFAGTMARSVTVIDENDVVLHGELVREIGDEPDYDAALAVLD